MNNYTPIQHKYWCTTIINEGKLNSWEKEFIQSVKMKLDMNISITDKQETVLEQLYDKVTSA